MNNLCLLSSARSGTNFVSSIFSEFDKFHILGEIFKADASGEFDYVVDALRLKGLDISPELFRVNNLTLIEDFFEKISRVVESSDIVFYKIFVEHISNPDAPNIYSKFLSRKAIDHDCIILYRDNLLSTFISNKLASVTNLWINGNYGDISIDFDIDEYCSWRDWIIHMWRSSLASLKSIGKLNVIKTLSYEQLIVNPHCVIGELIKYGIINGEIVKKSSNLTQKQSSKNSIEYLSRPEDAMSFQDDSLSSFVDFDILFS
jgi:hypothetical protein